jgi:hypothetical protein
LAQTWEEFTAQLHQKVERLPLNAPTIPRQIRSALYRAEDYDFFAYYILPEPLDYRHLNNVLYQVSRRTLLYFSIQGSGSDHCSAFVHTLNCFASNDFAVIDHIFPKALPLSQDPRYLGPAVNLLTVLYYKKPDLASAALASAERFLKKKSRAWDKHVIGYLQALYHKDAAAASHNLQDLCLDYQKRNQSVLPLVNKLEKIWASEVHGLYRLARVVDPELFRHIREPEHRSFDREFEQWQRENNYPQGDLAYTFPPEMEVINRILRAELPHMELHKPYPKKKYIFKNHEKFCQELAKNAGIWDGST